MRAGEKDEACPIARSMAVLGERWSMLILREAMLGVTRFSDFRETLGISADTLSARLSTLVDAGVFAVVEYQEPGYRRRHAYEMTEAGADASVILAALSQWGHVHLPVAEETANRFIDSTTGDQVVVRVENRDGRRVKPADVVLSRGAN